MSVSSLAPRVVRYAAAGWGVGELWLEGERVVWHELPVPPRGASADEHPLGERLRRYFAGEADAFVDVEVELRDETPFGRRLAAELRRVQAGEVVTYGELAALAGRPGAARAAGSFCARNRAPIVIPCHRVVAAGGIGRFGSLGHEYKRRLLELEGVRL